MGMCVRPFAILANVRRRIEKVVVVVNAGEINCSVNINALLSVMDVNLYI